MTKTELESLIHGVAASMIYGLCLMSHSERSGGQQAMIQEMKAGSGFKFEAPDGTYEGLEGDQLYARYNDPRDLQVSKGNFVFGLRSTLVRFCYEAIQLYCDDTGQKPLMKSESWYAYARVVRNTVSHGEHAVVRKWPPEWKQQATRRTSATWRHRTINETDVGKEITFLAYDAWKLHLDMLDFVQNRLQ